MDNCPIPKTLALVTNIPTPYRVPLFARLDARLRDEGWSLLVLFLAEGDAERRWHLDPRAFPFAHRFLPMREGLTPVGRVLLGLPAALRKIRPAGLVVGGFGPAAILSVLHARSRSIPVAIWSGALPRPGEADEFRRYLRHKLVRRASGCLAYGSAARDYLMGLGAPPARIFRAWNTVDLAAFAGAPLPPAPPLRLLSAGYLRRGKRVDLILRAVARARDLGGSVEIDIAGDGPRRAALEALARDLGVPARFLGHRAPEEMPAVYRACNAFAFASEYDIWGLVLLEAMAAGLPCFASVRAGATRDVVEDGRTGFALDFEDTETVAQRLLTEPAKLAVMGREGQVRARSTFSLDHSCDAWIEMVRTWSPSA